MEVAPRENEFVQETLMVLKNWQNSVRPPRWQSFWLKTVNVGILHWMIWLVAVLCTAVLLEQHAETAQTQKYREEARGLVDTTNVTAQTQTRAIQLLLAKTYGFAPQPIKRDFPNWFFLLSFGGFAYCLACSFAPTIAVGIGRGEKKVHFWRKYSKFILITTPTFVS